MGEYKTKVWQAKSTKFINTDSCCKNFEMCDKHIELQYTTRTMDTVVVIGILLCLGVMKFSTVAGILLAVVLWWINHSLATKMSKDLHFICCINYDTKYEEYFSIDLNTNEVLYIHYIIDGAYYHFEVVDLEFFKNYIANKSAYYYEMVKNITPETIDLLKNIQFGERKWKWVWFAKQKEKERIKIGCFRSGIQGDIYAKYAELSLDDYNKYFGDCSNLEELYRTFMNKKCVAFKDGNIRFFLRGLRVKEVPMLENIFDGNRRECDIPIERYFNKDLVVGNVHMGNASVFDMKAFEFLKYLSSGKKVEEFI